MKLFEDPSCGAELSPDGVYRYRLWRRWAPGPVLLFVMLNPSTADAETDDPTIRRCLGFAHREGFSAIEVVNLYALRATDPKALRSHPAPIGRGNVEVLETAIIGSEKTVAAFGAGWRRVPTARTWEIVATAPTRLLTPIFCLGTTKDGDPRHPLYVKADQPLVPWGRDV